MQQLPVTVIASLLTIVSLGTAYAANSEDDSPYVIQQEHAAPVTITELPEVHSSDTAAEATSIEDQQQTSEAYAERRQKVIEDCEQNNGIDCERQADIELGTYAERRQKMIDDCEQNNGIDCEREVDTELGAEAIPQRHFVHVVPRAHGVR
jgi:hypothetical protein